MRKPSLSATAFLQAAGVAAYVLLFATTVQFFGHRFESVRVSPVLSMALALTAFVFSAAVCSTVFFGYPAYLFFDGKKKESVRLIVQSIVWLAVFLIVFLALLPFTASV